MARYTYKEIGDNRDSDCLTTVIYDGMDIMAIVYDYGEEVEVEPKRDLTDEESNMVKQFCESLDYDTRQKVNESISIGENVDILDIYRQAREDFGELNQKSSLNESVKKKPETINEKLKRLDRKVFNEEFKTLDLAYNYSMINEDVVGKKVDMKTKQELRDFINREDDPEKIAKFMDVIINGDDNKKPNQLNNQRVQQSNIRTEGVITEAKEQNEDIMEIFNRNGWTVMKQGAGLMAYNYVIEHDSTIDATEEALDDFIENENHLIDELDALSEDITWNFNVTQEGHPTGTVTDWRRDAVEESLNEAMSNIELPEDVVKYCEYYFGSNPANILTFNEDGTITLEDDYDNYEFEDINQFINDMRYNIQATREMIEEDPDAYDEDEKEAVGINESLITEERHELQHGYVLTKRDNGNYLYDIQYQAPYDDSDYYWAYSNDGEDWVFVYKGKKRFSDEADDVKQVVDALQELNARISPRMVHN